jgi:transcriptional regulator NrdR family protein
MLQYLPMAAKSPIKVLKRDGSLEDYSTRTIKRILLATGLSETESASLASKVSVWAKKSNRKKISSLEIRDKVLDLLKDSHSYAYDKFLWYQNIKDKEYQNINL